MVLSVWVMACDIRQVWLLGRPLIPKWKVGNNVMILVSIIIEEGVPECTCSFKFNLQRFMKIKKNGTENLPYISKDYTSQMRGTEV